MRLWFLDSDSSDRKKNSLEKAKQAGFERVSSIDEADIVALHGTDVEDEIPYSTQPHYKDKLIFVYSGGKSSPKMDNKDIESRRVLYIMWQVKPNSYISLDDWKRIASLITEDKNWLQLTIFPLSIDYMSALAILCQGYLVAHFPQPSDYLPKPIQQALDMMGWSKFAKTKNGEDYTNNIIAQKVRDTVLKPKESQPEAKKQTIEDSLSAKFFEKFQKEWGDEDLPSEIDQLLKAIFTTTPLEDANLIAKAYLQLAKKLKGVAS